MKYRSKTIRFHQGQVSQVVEHIINLCPQYGVVVDVFDWEISLQDGVADDRGIEYCLSTRDSNNIWMNYQQGNIGENISHFDTEKDVELFLRDQVDRLDKLLINIVKP